MQRLFLQCCGDDVFQYKEKGLSTFGLAEARERESVYLY